MTRPTRLAVAGGIWLASFSALYSVGAALGLWPPPPLGGFGAVDLYAGLAFGLVGLGSIVYSCTRASGGRRSRSQGEYRNTRLTP